MAEADRRDEEQLTPAPSTPRAPSGPGSAAELRHSPHSATLHQAALETWGRAVGSRIRPVFIALRGPLGAGKSVLARAVARGAGVESPMPSPTYNLVYSYQGAGGVAVWHVDLYRLEHPDDVWELGWRELGEAKEEGEAEEEGGSIVLVEWPERVESLLPEDRWDVRLSRDPSDEGRRIVVVERRGRAPDPPALPDPERS